MLKGLFHPFRRKRKKLVILQASPSEPIPKEIEVETAYMEIPEKEEGLVKFNYYDLDDETVCIFQYEALHKPEVLEIPSELYGKTVTKIETLFLNDSSIKKVILPESVTVIGDFTFRSSAIEEVEIKGIIKELGRESFSYCSKLKKLSFREGLVKISEYAIMDCPELCELYLPDSIEVIEGDGIFSGCSKNLIIHTPAGSYVEMYAGFKNIRLQIGIQSE